MEKMFLDFLTNDWVHMVAKVGRIEGQQKMLIAGVGLLIALVGTLIGLVVKG